MIFVVIALSCIPVFLEGRLDDGFVLPLYDLLWVDIEGNIPTAAAFGFIAVAWLLVTVTAWQQWSFQAPWRRYWTALSAIFIYLGYDEAAQVHEALIVPMRTLFGASGVFYFAWIIPALLALIVIGAFFLRFVIALPPQVRTMVFISAAVYLSGAVGMEMIGGAVRDSDTDPWISYGKVVMIEETLEFFGMMLFSTAILKLLRGDTEASRRYLAG